MTPDQINIQLNAALVTEAQDNLRSAVDRARAGGLSWAGVGDALGITRQAAWERFSTAPSATTDQGGD